MAAHSLRPAPGAHKELRFEPRGGVVHVFGWQGEEGRIVDRMLRTHEARKRYRMIRAQGWVATEPSTLGALRKRAFS